MNRNLMQSLIGAVGGLAATIPMSAVMLSWHRKAWRRLDPLPPREITERALDTVGIRDDISSSSEEWLTVANHFGYGAAMGAVYGAVSGSNKNVTAGVAKGAVYGLGVWAGSYLGWLPSTGMYRPVDRDWKEKTGIMIAAHLVWGGSLGLATVLLSRSLRRRGTPASQPESLERVPAQRESSTNDRRQGLPVGYDPFATDRA